MLRLRVTLIVGLAMLCAPAQAKTILQGLALLNAGYNDNPFGTTVGTPDYFMEVRPRLRLTSSLDRALLYMGYTFDAVLYAQNHGVSGYSNQFEAGTLIDTSRSTRIDLEAAITQSTFANFALLQASSGAVPVIQPSGTTQFLSVTGGEGVTWDVAPRWRLTEHGTTTFLEPLGSSLGSTAFDGLLSTIHDWTRDLGSIDTRVDYVSYPAGTTATGAALPSQGQVLLSTSLRWVHDFGQFISTELMAGGLIAMRADDGGGLLGEPIGRAGIYYRRKEGAIDLTYDHTFVASVLSAQTLISDLVSLHGTVPFGERSKVVLAAGLGYQFGQTYDSTSGTLTGSLDVWLADATLTWSPLKEMQLFARYQYIDQIGAVTTVIPIQSFSRNLVLLGINIQYPAEGAAPFGFHGSVRADRSDEVRTEDAHQAPDSAPAPQQQKSQ